MGKRKFDIGDSILFVRKFKSFDMVYVEKTFVSNVLLYRGNKKRGVAYEVESEKRTLYVSSNELKLTRLILLEKIIPKLLLAQLISEDQNEPF